MAAPDFAKRAVELRARLDAFREMEALVGSAVDELFVGVKQACAHVNAARPDACGAERLNPQHWGYSLYVYFRDRILINCAILPVNPPSPGASLLKVEVSINQSRPLKFLTLERSAPASVEWRSEGHPIDPEEFFLELMERYANTWRH